ncbi:KTSC domain-containing protein [Stenotrophomonas sp. TWI809]|uniref:KTSC domain-containing protein n=1 Tax=Stenotrophomonas sp. TWI809 TaxID=3136796 RepID=UPI00320B0C57
MARADCVCTGRQAPARHVRFFRGSGDKRGPGSLYHYANFDAADFAAFKAADSVGSYFGKNIKACPEEYPFQKINEAAQAA